MIDLSAISNQHLLGRALRAPLRLIPPGLVVPILQGPLRGARWVVGSSNHSCWLGCFEAAKQRACMGLVTPGMTVYDLGANVGFYTLLFSRLVKTLGTVHAFEPLFSNIRYLQRHLELNRVMNAHVHGMAVGQKTGNALFDPAPGPSMGHVVIEASASTITVPMVSLDDFVYVHSHKPPDLIKMDVEGAEADVLAGMVRLLQDRRPTLLVAIHGTGPWQACCKLLAEAGYAVHSLTGALAEPNSELDEIVAVPLP